MVGAYVVGRKYGGYLDMDDELKVIYGEFGNLLAEAKMITGGPDEQHDWRLEGI